MTAMRQVRRIRVASAGLRERCVSSLFDCHHRRKHCCNKLFLGCVARNNIATTDGNSATRPNDVASGNKSLTQCWCKQIHFELDREYGCSRGCEAHSAVAARDIQYCRYDSGGDVPKLLGQVIAKWQRNIDFARLDPNKLRTNRAHQNQLGETGTDIFLKIWVQWFSRLHCCDPPWLVLHRRLSIRRGSFRHVRFAPCPLRLKSGQVGRHCAKSALCHKRTHAPQQDRSPYCDDSLASALAGAALASSASIGVA